MNIFARLPRPRHILLSLTCFVSISLPQVRFILSAMQVNSDCLYPLPVIFLSLHCVLAIVKMSYLDVSFLFQGSPGTEARWNRKQLQSEILSICQCCETRSGRRRLSPLLSLSNKYGIDFLIRKICRICSWTEHRNNRK